jgi:hypothetical protein
MLELGVLCGKYLTDCRSEFPASWFARAKPSPSGRDCLLNYFGVDASQSLSVWRHKGWIQPDGPARLIPVVLPLFHGPADARRGCSPDRPLESDAAACLASEKALRAGQSHSRPGQRQVLLHWACDSRMI